MMAVASCAVTGPGPADLPTEAVVRIEAPKCASLTNVEGTGVAVGPDLIATVAHTFASVDEFTVIDASGRRLDGQVVYLDRERDVALVRTAKDLPRSLTLAAAETDTSGFVLSAADPDEITIKETTIRRRLTITLDGEGERNGLEIEAVISSGDSGAPVLDDEHRVVGLVFASSDPPGRGWALDAAEVQAALDRTGDPIELACL